MLLLPLEEDSWLFRLCLCYGLLVLLLELLVPLVFHRRVRVELPRVALRGVAAPLATREFVQRRRALQQQLAALQRALAETPRRSPQRRKQLDDASASTERPDVPASPSASPTSSVKVTRPRKRSEAKRRVEQKFGGERKRDGQVETPRREDEEVGSDAPVSRQRPEPVTRPAASAGFSFDEAGGYTQRQEAPGGPVEWAVNVARQRDPPMFSGRRPVRLVAEGVGAAGYAGPSEAVARLEALIRSRRRKRATAPSYPPPAPAAVASATVSSSSPPLEDQEPTTSGDAARGSPGDTASHAPAPAPQPIPQPMRQPDEECVLDDDEETKDSEQAEPLTDFQAFCASFVAGGSVVAQQAVAKRKHHEAFGLENEQIDSGAAVAQRSAEKRKLPRVLEQDDDDEQVIDGTVPAAPQSAEKREYHEAFGPEDEAEVDNAVAAEHKRNYYEAFGSEDEAAVDNAVAAEHKRNHYEAFGSEDEAEVDNAVAAEHKRNQYEAFGSEDEAEVDNAVAAEHKRNQYEAFGSEDEAAVDNAAAAEYILEKRKHDEAFGADGKQEQPQEK
ncbi:unnamed protein product [Phytophthora fragariaefolia]|uniref:Unnamed protein product n=1 Tax=Phytophthora fragariaefolia TaxID=1490495 RepID=A0A9W6WV19_9STRA|nr:unnamed protein product [Phytophthora fragariaefolia]